MKLTLKPLAAFITLLIFGAPHDVVWGDSHAMLNKIVAPSIFGEELAIDDITLSEMRGGFTTTSGLQVNFGIQRVLYVNGALVSTTSLNLLNLGNVNVPSVAPVTVDVGATLPSVEKLSTPAITLPQTNTGAAVASTPTSGNIAPPSAAPATAASAPSTLAGTPSSTEMIPPNAASSSAGPAAVASTPNTSSASSTVSSSAPASSVTSIPGSVALIQVGGGNSVSPGAFSASSAGTVIQNTLNNQKIQNVTIISATVNSLQILKAMNLQLAINSAINDSVRK